MNIRATTAACLIIITCVSAMTGCSNVNEMQGMKARSTGGETLTVKAPAAGRFSIRNETGSISLKKIDGDSVKIRLVKTVRGKTLQDVEEVLKNILPFAEIHDGTFEVGAVMKGSGGELWKWMAENRNKANASLEYSIEIPKDFDDYSLEEITGNIDISSLKGTFSIKCVTGDIKLKNMSLFGSNILGLTTGSIDLDVNLDKATDLNVTNITGNVNITLPSNTKVSTELKTTTGTISGGLIKSSRSASGKAELSDNINGGGTKLSVLLTTGNIEVNRK